MDMGVAMAMPTETPAAENRAQTRAGGRDTMVPLTADHGPAANGGAMVGYGDGCGEIAYTTRIRFVPVGRRRSRHRPVNVTITSEAGSGTK